MKRRDFLHTLGAGSALAFLPAFTRSAFAAAATLDELTIAEVDVLKVSGTHTLVPGLDRQYQVNPLHLYGRPPAEAVQGSAARDGAGVAASVSLLRAHPHQGRPGRFVRRL